VVAVGDVHGAYDRFAAILRTAGLIDSRDRWVGGKAILVQTGDVLDRGPDSRKAIDLIRKLEKDARRAGGRVLPLLGNHELMRLVSDWRYVSQGEYDAFKTRQSADLRQHVLDLSLADRERQARTDGTPFDAAAFRETFLKEIPLGSLEMHAAFDAKGEYGAWMRSLPAVARINGVVFLHGGISAEVAPMGCEGVNAAVRKDLESLPVAPDKVPALFVSSDTGPLWYRGLASDPEVAMASAIDTILQNMKARAIVVGHTTVPGRVTERLGGRVVLIDTGMVGGTFYPGGVASALELKGDIVTAVYLDRREQLDVPGLHTAPAADAASR